VVLADTHLRTAPPGGRAAGGKLPEAVWDHVRGADAVLHAGDVLDIGVLHLLGEHCPVYAVLGNNDPSLVGTLPATRVADFGGVKIAMVHNSGGSVGRAHRMRRRFPEADVVVFGHSHAPVNEQGEGGQLLFNPGSPTQRRAQPRPTFGELRIADGVLVAHRIIPLDGPSGAGRGPNAGRPPGRPPPV
jgi:putative phosphoesterase